MHNNGEKVVCPNCGFETSHNYCAQCGQETHLHKDNFWGLVTHFTGHYFHYDSKFWATIKTLFFKPGMLTTAYKNKQRARYVPPISLYIFVSIIYFILFSYTQSNYTKKDVAELLSEKQVKSKTEISTVQESDNISQKLSALLNDEERMYEVLKKTEKAMPKFFFCMVPILGLMLLLLFYSKQNVNYADHSIFALHVHSFGFLLFIITLLPLPDVVNTIAKWAMLAYLILAIRNFYHTGWIRAIIYGCIITILYIVLFFMMVTGVLMLYAVM